MPAMMFTPFEPKATNRFIFYIDGIESYLIKSTDTPSYDTGEIVIDYINVDFKVKSVDYSLERMLNLKQHQVLVSLVD